MNTGYHPDTIILTEDLNGFKVGRINVDQRVLSFDRKSNELKSGWIKSIDNVSVSEYCRLKLEDGTVILAGLDSGFLNSSGKIVKISTINRSTKLAFIVPEAVRTNYTKSEIRNMKLEDSRRIGILESHYDSLDSKDFKFISVESVQIMKSSTPVDFVNPHIPTIRLFGIKTKFGVIFTHQS